MDPRLINIKTEEIIELEPCVIEKNTILIKNRERSHLIGITKPSFFGSRKQSFVGDVVTIIPAVETSRYLIPRHRTHECKDPNVSKKKIYSLDKVRYHLPKRCSDVYCSYKQHYNLDDAIKNRHGFNKKPKKTYCCACGSTIQYYHSNSWVRSSGLTKRLKKSK